MKKNLRIIIGVIAAGLLILQFFKPAKDNPPVDPKLDLITVNNPPENVRVMLKTSCYDCHSHETVYPWYFGFAPVAFRLNDHITEGREEMNFSEWEKYPAKDRQKYVRRAVRFIEQDKMPLWDYKLIHTESKLTDEQKKELTDWFKNLKITEK
jgi:hypothetical protein